MMKRLIYILLFLLPVISYGQQANWYIIGKGTSAIPTNAWDKPNSNAGISFSNGNLTTATPGGTVYLTAIGLSTFAHNSGKYYYVTTITTSTGNSMTIGVGTTSVNLSKYAGQETISWGIYESNGAYYHNGSTSSSGTSFIAGDEIGVAADITAGKIWFSKNGTWMSSGNPSTGANPAMTGVTGNL